jgi:hypothetical protein
MFPKIVVLYEIYSKKITVTEYLWHVSVYYMHIISFHLRMVIHIVNYCIREKTS